MERDTNTGEKLLDLRRSSGSGSIFNLKDDNERAEKKIFAEGDESLFDNPENEENQDE